MSASDNFVAGHFDSGVTLNILHVACSDKPAILSPCSQAENNIRTHPLLIL